MSSVIPVLGALIAAAITPGPNNFIVMQAGARGGFAAALPAMLGIVGGSIVLLLLVWIGFAAAFRTVPALELAVSVIGSTYIAWLGISLLTRGGTTARAELPSTPLGIAAFQLLNPKAWILIATTTAAMSDRGGLALLLLLVVLVTSTCLSLWALAGVAAARLFRSEQARSAFDRSMGLLLAVSAAALLIDSLTRHLA